uniref:MBL fold metallo-hydrolase n=1 Tax=Chryseobacterium sp. TaxID=1871047 RepID=UPI0025B850B8
ICIINFKIYGIMQLYHLNCVEIDSPMGSKAIGHCLLIKKNNNLILIDTGIGLLDIQNPEKRIGKELIDIVGYSFNENQTALRQIENLGFDPQNVTDCVISHLDNDHIGGLADFPNATVHVGIEEFNNFNSGNPRYLKIPLAHNPIIKTYKKSDFDWFGFEARKVNVSIEAEIYLVPLFGHTLGHCGVALKADKKWLFYVADAYYLKSELTDFNHPVNELARVRADDNDLRIATLDKLRRFVNNHPEVDIWSYHDEEEFGIYQKK